MLMRIRTLLVLAVCVVGASSFADARQGTAPASVLDALLAEVRSLRVAMEQMASAGPRVQLALGRLQLQEQRVNTLVRRQESIRAQIAETERMRDTLMHRNQQFDAAMREETGPDERRRREFEQMADQHKRELGRAIADLQRLNMEEASVSGEVATEQGRWTEINQRLEELERALTRR
jgi:predicted transcriptional regulator